VSDLLQHLEEIGRPLFEDSGTRFEVRLADPSTADLSLAPERKRHLALLFREALNNARRHARAEHVEVTAERSGSRLRVEVRDDGCGFDEESARSAGGMGLPGFRERAERAGGTVAVEAAPQCGTLIRFEADILE